MGTPHIAATIEEVAKQVILVEEASVVDDFADRYLTDPVVINEIRGMRGITGRYSNQELSVFSIGIGIPSAAIYVNELLEEYDIQKLIFITSCRPLTDDTTNGTVIVASGCCTDSHFMRHVFPGDFAPLADYELLSTTYSMLQQTGISPRVGLLLSSDTITINRNSWIEHGVLGVDMASAVIYTLAAKNSARAVSISVVTDERLKTIPDDIMSSAVEIITEHQ
ncbi:MAG: purine-nucleoside phosphorylase [Oscillospiraceae bacterium]|nr:purine-nucleoside phosphorylase [Oscillospiraceae bacterium]